MIETDLHFRVKQLSAEIGRLESEIEELKTRSNENEMWDNSDMIRNWKISQRTLATWRSEGLIDYVQAGGKIWYTKMNRNDFLLRNTVRAKDVEIATCSN
ncbi:MAG: hypothetical protein ACOCWC_06130 [Bacteroidota bacterium]